MENAPKAIIVAEVQFGRIQDSVSLGSQRVATRPP